MLNYKTENNASDYAFQLVNVYESPKELFPVEECHFLISESIPSPMGAFLTAFRNESDVKDILAKNGGEIFTWLTLMEHHKRVGLNDYK